jgi:hypothetical protein
MDRTSLNEPRELSFEQLADAHDLRSAISAALDASPMDEQSLRRGIWTYVGAERDLGATPAQVIVTLTQLVDASKIGPVLARQAVMRRVILWCVEAYFGHLGGEGGAEAASANRAVPPMIVSNR